MVNWLLWFAAVAVLGQSLKADAPAVLISNCLREAPNGIAWVVQNRAAFVVNPETNYNDQSYQPGPASPDDRYHLCQFTNQTAQIGVIAVNTTPADGSFQWHGQPRKLAPYDVLLAPTADGK